MTNELDFRFMLSDEDVRNYARLSGDWNPVHIEEGAAKEAGFEGCVAHGMLVVARALSLIRQRKVLRTLSVTFHRPILVGDEVYVHAVQDGDTIKLSISTRETVAIKGTIAI